MEKLELGEEISLVAGDDHKLKIPPGEIHLSYDGEVLGYRRFAEADGKIAVEKSFLIKGNEKLRLRFSPLYPDRPVIIKPLSDLVVPPGERGVFFASCPLASGFKLLGSDTVLEELLDKRRKNSYWGPPTEGILAYQLRAPVGTDISLAIQQAGKLVAVLPIIFVNNSDVAHSVQRCLVPFRELDLYKTVDGQPVFETLRIDQQSDTQQNSRPAGRTSHKLKKELQPLSRAPNPPRTLLSRVGHLSGFEQLTGVFIGR